jgi:imidazolonepropionase-like amidohydrolase
VLAFARRHNVRPLILGGAEAWRVAAPLAAARVPVLLDPLAALPASYDALGTRLDNAARLHRAGVPVSFSQFDSAAHLAGKLRQAAGNAVAHGLPWEAALAGLTRVPAEAFGVGDTLGRIEPGLVADLVLWSGDPLEVTSLPDQVWMRGVARPLRSRQSELRDRYLPPSGAWPRAYPGQ